MLIAFLPYLMGIAVFYVLRRYVIEPRDIAFHALVVLIPTLAYTYATVGGMPPWLLAHDLAVRYALLVLQLDLMVRAALLRYPKAAPIVGAILLGGLLVGIAIRAFWV